MLTYSNSGKLTADHLQTMHDMLFPRKAVVVALVDVLEYLHIFKRIGCIVKRQGKLSIFDIGGHDTIKHVYVSSFLPSGAGYLLDLNAIDDRTRAAIHHFNKR